MKEVRLVSRLAAALVAMEQRQELALAQQELVRQALVWPRQAVEQRGLAWKLVSLRRREQRAR
jgi:hypothetical protein